MPEIAPSPRLHGEHRPRLHGPLDDTMQAWGTYGVNCGPSCTSKLGVDPDLGHGKLSIVPQVPGGQQKVAVATSGSAAEPSMSAHALRTRRSAEVTIHGVDAAVTIGAVLPAGAKVAGVSVDGRSTQYKLVETTRGTEVHVVADGARSTLRIALR